MQQFLRQWLADESGAASAEYILIYAVVGAGFVAGSLYFGEKIRAAMTARGDILEACAGTSPGNC